MQHREYLDAMYCMIQFDSIMSTLKSPARMNGTVSLYVLSFATMALSMYFSTLAREVRCEVHGRDDDLSVGVERNGCVFAVVTLTR